MIGYLLLAALIVFVAVVAYRTSKFTPKAQPATNDEEITFDKVIAVHNRTLKVGKPYVKDAFVKGTVLKNGKGKKITVFTYKPKKGCARKMGYRQPYTKVQINEIG